MKKTCLIALMAIALSVSSHGQNAPTRIFTMFTSGGCGCTGSGGEPETFTTHEEVMEQLRNACADVDFTKWEGTYGDAYEEVTANKNDYHGVLIIGRVANDYRLAFTGLPTIVVYNLFEFMDAQPYRLFKTGRFSENSVLQGGADYDNPRILTAQLDRRNLSTPDVREAMFEDLVYKINLIRVIHQLSKTRILMLKRDTLETIAAVNYRGDHTQSFPPGFNEHYLRNFEALFGAEVVVIEPGAFYEEYQNTSITKAEEVADEWIRNARKVEAIRPEIIKNARAYLAIDALREKHDCNAVSTHIRAVAPSGELKDNLFPGLGMELGFKTRGIMAVCQNYPDILISQVLAYLLKGRPSMLGDFIYDTFNSTETVLHCGIPVNPYGDHRRLPYTIRTHAESPVRDLPEQPGSATGLTAEWPEGETVTVWEMHSLLNTIRLHTGVVVDGHAIYSGGEDLDNVMCTAKIVIRHDDIEKIQQRFEPCLYGIHTAVTLGDLRKPLKDIATLMGFRVVESDR